MKLYVGTYAKYNAGSIDGAWIDLDKFRCYEDFIKACLKVHSDEADPELMFQDCEMDAGCDWQRGLYSESSAPKDYWSLKKEFAKEAKKPLSKADKADREEQKKLRAEYRQQLKDDGAWHDDRMLDFCSKSPARIVKLSDGSFIAIDKPSIKTEFCYGENDRGQGGDEPGTMNFALKQCDYAKTRDGFMWHNIGEYTEEIVRRIGRKTLRAIEWLENGRVHRVYLTKHYSSAKDGSKCLTLDYCSTCGRHDRPSDARDLTADDAKRIRHAYMLVRADYKKRLNAWWKRFGAEKIHTWTFWTEE